MRTMTREIATATKKLAQDRPKPDQLNFPSDKKTATQSLRTAGFNPWQSQTRGTEQFVAG
jgi:hypothetical protein